MPSGLMEEIRPGVYRPDWSVVTKPAARSALIRSGLAEKWGLRLLPKEDLAWRTVLEAFANSGRPPSVLKIAEKIGVSDGEARTLLIDLRAHDLLGLDESATKITYAYPFANTPTEHRVELDGRCLYGVCAIDALGVAGMLRNDTRIESACRACRGRIEIGTTRNGKALGRYHPAEAVVWYDLAYTQAAATSCCTVIAFFCSDPHLDEWLLAQNPKRTGYRLTFDEGLEVGRALFEPVLAATSLL
jgi:hypothetical protein